MGKVFFLFGIHNHQPEGNDAFVFNKAFEECYYPFLNVLKEFPNIKCSMHFSGPLYDWIIPNKPDYFNDLKEMADSGQIEIISGGYYEPILPIISDEDKFSQIRLMNDFIKKEYCKMDKISFKFELPIPMDYAPNIAYIFNFFYLNSYISILLLLSKYINYLHI